MFAQVGKNMSRSKMFQDVPNTDETACFDASHIYYASLILSLLSKDRIVYVEVWREGGCGIA